LNPFGVLPLWAARVYDKGQTGKRWLRNISYQVRAAASGEKLRIAVAQPQPDLILLDVMMPGMGGYEVFERLRANPVTRDIPIRSRRA
jgi:CheY-like chemotaxis protein